MDVERGTQRDDRWCRRDQSGSRRKIEVILSPDSPGSTLLTIRHSEVPDDHRGYEDGGWLENYFEPMQEYFASR